jgi:succinate dehydrogenase hydrophobic anchor subunit
MKESKLWSLHLLCGALIFFLIAIHFGVMHLDELLGFSEVLKYENVIVRGKEAFYLVVYTLLLGASLYHGLYGFRNIMCELGFGRTIERTISLLILVIGLVAFIYGEIAIVKAFTIKEV